MKYTAADLNEALDLLEEAEWAEKTWTDYPTCPWCSAMIEDFKPKPKHEEHCRWLKIMQKHGRRP